MRADPGDVGAAIAATASTSSRPRCAPSARASSRPAHHAREAADLVRDLGGDVSTQQLALVDLAMLLVNSLPAYVLSMPSPVNRQRRCLHPVVRERQALVNQLQSILRDLGLQRRAKPVADLSATWQAERMAGVEPKGVEPSTS